MRKNEEEKRWTLTDETAVVVTKASIPAGFRSILLAQFFLLLLIDDDRRGLLLDLIDIFMQALQQIPKEFLTILFSKSTPVVSFHSPGRHSRIAGEAWSELANGILE